MSTTNILDLNNRLDKIEKSGSGGGSAAETSYSNTTSGLTATNVQAAIDEIDGVTDNLSSAITDIEGDIVAIEGDIDNLEEDVTKLGGDTDWIQIGTGDTYYRKIGKIVFVRTDTPAASTSTWVTFDTLPEGFRPVSTVRFSCYGGPLAQLSIRILDTGEIQYINDNAASVPVYTSFIADN